MDHVGPDAWFAVKLADIAEKGSWPRAGGMLDQSSQFVDAARQVWSEDAHWKAEASKG